MNEDQTLSLVHSIILLVFLSGGLIMHFKDRPANSLKYAAMWLVIILALVILYSYRYDFYDIKDRLVATLSPASAVTGEDGSLSFRVSQDGHFYINTQVNGKDVRFMVDTGASDIVLDPNTAKKIGINLRDLNYTKTYNTANGTVRGASISLKTIQIGDYTLKDVRASVNEADMDKPLLGMSFLEKLDGYEVKRGTLTLWP